VHGVDAGGKTVLRKSLSRAKLLELMAQMPACRIGIEAWIGVRGSSACSSWLTG
jgi:transposase